jgi:enterochelin esterase-like enzyme
MLKRRNLQTAVLVAAMTVVSTAAYAQQGGRGNQPQVISPEVQADRKVTFRILAPQAQAVRLSGGDIQGLGQNNQLTKGENGVWELTVGPIDPGTYRYTFNVDGVATLDPRSPFTSESNNNVWSVAHVPGLEFADTKQVPHGSVAAVTYYSSTLGTFRRMHVYTPPGYERNSEKYPVFYLLHGAGDSDHSWTSVGRANFILDNLIAAKKAKPMLVVMPAGHTRRGPNAPGAIATNATEEFVKDFMTDIVPYIEKNYRVQTDRANTAIAGLSMGGNHTLQAAIPNLGKFGYIGVYSSGLLGTTLPGVTPGGRGGRGNAPAAAAPPAAPATPPPPPPTVEEWAKKHAATLDNPGLKKGLKVFWFAIGKDDFLLQTNNATVDFFKKRGFAPVVKETDGGHTWINWRNYLHEFAPMLFQ